MKTTKKNVLVSKIEKIVKSKDVSKGSIAYGWLLELAEGEKQFRPVYTQGSTWKHSSLIDKTQEFSKLLRLLKIDFNLTNDAARGGKTGALITINTKVLA